jgi:hypothetical protein
MRLSNTALVLVIFAAAILLAVLRPVREYFGSPGTYVQLATSHVPTAEDAYYYADVYPREVRREIKDMTGDDPGSLRPWVFPMSGTYYA